MLCELKNFGVLVAWLVVQESSNIASLLRVKHLTSNHPHPTQHPRQSQLSSLQVISRKGRAIQSLGPEHDYQGSTSRGCL